jgi:hypothetical protein
VCKIDGGRKEDWNFGGHGIVVTRGCAERLCNKLALDLLWAFEHGLNWDVRIDGGMRHFVLYMCCFGMLEFEDTLSDAFADPLQRVCRNAWSDVLV